MVYEIKYEKELQNFRECQTLEEANSVSRDYTFVTFSERRGYVFKLKEKAK